MSLRLSAVSSILFKRVQLTYWTVRFLTPSQIWYRFQRTLRHWWWRVRSRKAPQITFQSFSSPVSLYSGLKDTTRDGPWKKDWEAAILRARDVSKYAFLFLNQRACFNNKPGWHDQNLSQLWRYHLHYFDYIQDLMIWSEFGENDNAYLAFKELTNSWIEENKILSGDGWHPYTISLRLVNWLEAASFFKLNLAKDEQFWKKIYSSIYFQAGILFKDVEFDVRGNHLLKNLKALIWAGLTFEGEKAENWFKKAMVYLEKELEEQVLGDGGHFERNPGYHLIVLQDCLEIGLLLKRKEKQIPFWLDESIKRMLEFLLKFLPPNGELPLLKDSTWNNGISAYDLLATGSLYFDDSRFKLKEIFGLYPLLIFGYSGWERVRDWPLHDGYFESSFLPESGYYILRGNGAADYLIFDCGDPCPDYLPAHAHADMFSYELIVDNQRIVVDSGVYEYAAGSWRDYFRSTRAHNTVEVEGRNQSEVWSSFRVAQRAKPSQVNWWVDGSVAFLQGHHDGYERLPVSVRHRRTVFCRENSYWGFFDELWGDGVVESKNYIHFHPDLHLEGQTDSRWQIVNIKTPIWIFSFGHESFAVCNGQTQPLFQGWYSERFGNKIPNIVLALHGRRNLPVFFGYIISKKCPVEARVSQVDDGYQILLKNENIADQIGIPKHNPPYLK